MKYKLLWSGLADENYYNVIAQYCIHSWLKLPGDKNIVSDTSKVCIPGILTYEWKDIENRNSSFLKINPNKKPWSFWRKMQCQVWATRTFKEKYDFIILLDTDIEVLDFDNNMFKAELDQFIESDLPWATGRSQSRLHDSGFIIVNTKHKLLDEVIDFYENIWESGEICNLAKPYDGHAVESMFDLYPSYKIMNTDYGKGMHVYDLGFVHYGSKLPKALRKDNPSKSGKELIEIYTKDKILKNYKT
jgi:hypothetical protein